MQFRVFTIPAIAPTEDDCEELNAFLRSHKVLNVERQLIADGQSHCWTFCVSYVTGSSAETKSSPAKRPRVDYKEVLNEQDFAVFAKLRTLRKELSDGEGVPAYALFTNEQLAEMVRHRVTTKAGLAKIKGVGEARIEKYGQAFLAMLSESKGNDEQANAEA